MEGRDSFVIKDQLTQDYHRLDAVSGTLAQLLDGTRSPEDLLKYAVAHWPGIDFDADYIADLMADLKRLKFIEDPFQRRAMVEARSHEERAQINAKTFQNLFSIPLGTIDPDRFLTQTYPRVAFLFRPFYVWLGMLLFLLAGYVVITHPEHVAASSGKLLLGPGRELLGAFLLWFTVTVVIIIHELGHGYAVKHFGGEAKQLGFIFIFGLPCMFCDTSDSHLFPNWKHRAYVALAGTYVELYVAAIATWIWWLTPTDLAVNQLAYNVMVFASLSGIVFNYNPLIKMDGYYVLADILDMPNLQENSYSYLGYLVRRYVFRLKVESPVHGRRRKQTLALYGGLSLAYSIFFAVVIYLFFRHELIKNFAVLGVLASVLLVVLVLRRLLKPAAGAMRLWVVDHRGEIRRNLVPILAAALLLLGAFTLVPIPGTRALRVAIEPIRVAALVAPEDLRVEALHFKAGDPVQPGQLLATLSTDSMAIERESAAAGAAMLSANAAGARRRGDRADATRQLEFAAAERTRTSLLERRLARAELRAPFAGIVLTPVNPDWLGYEAEAGDTLCLVGDLSRVRARARVEAMDLEELPTGSRVRVRLRSEPGRALRGRIAATEPLEPRPGGVRDHRIWIQLDDVPREPRAGLGGIAHVVTPRRSAAAHLFRWITRFVRTDLWV